MGYLKPCVAPKTFMSALCTPCRMLSGNDLEWWAVLDSNQ